MEIQDYIPIDNAIKDFEFHLKSHPRTILSAGFGEGKTFFLHQCRNTISDYVFLTLYPVNYQVATNEDIFDLIKRDILFQLFMNDILKPGYRIPTRTAISFFISNPINYWEWIIDTVASLDYPDDIALKVIPKVSKLFKKAYDSFEKFCEKNGINETDKICLDLWKKIEEKGIYENDVITRLIVDSIKIWKEKNPNKKIVLLVEDLDRIDPAHLFRILNILSAHIDYSYKYGLSPERDTVVGNKFGVDNIVCVLDYNNLISIFRHFYGEYTSWEGYISKFSTKGYFQYSLTEEKCKYFYSKAASFCGLDSSLIKEFISEEIVKNTSMRQLNAALGEIDSQFIPVSDYYQKGVRKVYPMNLLKFFVIVRRLGKQNSEIVELVMKTLKVKPELKELILPYYFLKTNSELKVISLGEKDKSGYLIQYDYTQNDHETKFKGGKCLLSGYDMDAKYPSIQELVLYMLNNVGR